MTATLPPPTSTDAPPPETPAAPSAAGAGEQTPAWGWSLAAAGALSAAAAGWMAAGLFSGAGARIVAVVAAALGAALAGLSLRMHRPGLVQWLLAPAGGLLGIAFAVPDAGGGSANIVGLVRDVLAAGGLGQPPVPFDPGWRVLLALLVTTLAGSAVALAAAADRPVRAAAIPVPILVLAALGQPAGAETLSTAIAVVLALAAFVVASASEQAGAGSAAGAYRTRRLVSSVAALAAVAVGVVTFAQVAGSLLPEPRDNQVVPPQRPPTSAPQPDRELYRVDDPDARPWRLGVLDVFADNAWMLPPFDPARLVPAGGAVLEEHATAPTDGGETVTVTLVDLGGRALPVPAGAVAVQASRELEFDPRTGSLRSVELPRVGDVYTVTLRPAISQEILRSAPPGGDELAPFLQVPPPSPAVRDLLAEAPVSQWFDRLQVVRQAYFGRVVAAGVGDPVDITMKRVDEILAGQDASPFEITAVEALLARWAGVPARIGYGYLGGDALDGGRSLRPRDGRVWLEVHVADVGWLPLVGTPPRATASFSDSERNDDPSVVASDRLALITFVPVQRQTYQLLFEVVRYWLVRVVPALALLVLAGVLLPAPRRWLRRRRRRRWARARGPAARIAVAYAELREALWDLNLARLGPTPLELVGILGEDAEHRDLAFLVTRALWGDLRRDLTDADAAAAEQLAASVTRRVRAAQPAGIRLAGLASRASLRTTWSDDLPGARSSSPPPASARRRRRGRRRVALASLIGLLLAGCAQPVELGDPAAAAALPARLVPGRVLGLAVEREPTAEEPFAAAGPSSLVAEGRVYTLRDGEIIQAALQVASLRPGAVGREDEVQRGILAELGGGRFEPVRVGLDRFEVLASASQQLVLWFAPDGSRYHLLVAPAAFEHAEEVMALVLRYQRGEDVTAIDVGELRASQARDVREGVPA